MLAFPLPPGNDASQCFEPMRCLDYFISRHADALLCLAGVRQSMSKAAGVRACWRAWMSRLQHILAMATIRDDGTVTIVSLRPSAEDRVCLCQHLLGMRREAPRLWTVVRFGRERERALRKCMAPRTVPDQPSCRSSKPEASRNRMTARGIDALMTRYCLFLLLFLLSLLFHIRCLVSKKSTHLSRPPMMKPSLKAP